ncbi:MAG: BON domain-containing protein [Gammaproteobacteria bacterium]|nr:BON domain-containing protein [Gammaproteobacteria bacterium]
MRRLVVLVFALIVSGCSAMMVGGGSGGGGYRSDDRSAAQESSDWSITTSLKSQYAANVSTRDFNLGVSTDRGRVVLSGTVDTYAVRETAEKLALATDGVKAVDNRIRVAYAK